MMMKEVRPESIVVEMCDERYDRWLADVVAHPNYEKTISEVHKILDSEPN
jgi:pheromone shutdown protein TraB